MKCSQPLPGAQKRSAGMYENRLDDSSGCTAGLAERRALHNGLRLEHDVNLQLAVLEARFEVHGDEVTPWGNLFEICEGRVQVLLVRRALRLLRGHGLLVAGDLTLEVRLGALELRDRVVDLFLEGLERSLCGLLLAVRLLDILHDIRLDHRENLDDARALTLRLLVGVRFPGVRRRRRRLPGLDEGLLPDLASLHLHE